MTGTSRNPRHGHELPIRKARASVLSNGPGMPVTGREHVHEIPLTVCSTHEGPQADHINVYPLEDVHFATVEEKKRLWLRDALINTLFIAAWYVKCIPSDYDPT